VTATLGSGTPGSTNLTFALMAKDVLGLNLKIVRGYPGAPSLTLGMQSGEIDGQVVLLISLRATQRGMWESGQFRPLVQFGRVTRLPELPDVPTARELVASIDGAAMLDFAELPFFMSLPLLGPPQMHAERSQAIEAAFMAMTQDAAFREEALKLEIDLSPIDGAHVLDLLKKAASTPKAVIARYNEIVPTGN
jgi:tripartite-type tricarboxylate transporter receptor subunit TctC